MSDEDGHLDMYITNAFEQIFRAMMATIGGKPARVRTPSTKAG